MLFFLSKSKTSIVIFSQKGWWARRASLIKQEYYEYIIGGTLFSEGDNSELINFVDQHVTNINMVPIIGILFCLIILAETKICLF